MGELIRLERKCETCHGTGKVEVTDTRGNQVYPMQHHANKAWCSACNGTGIIRRKKSHAKGS